MPLAVERLAETKDAPAQGSLLRNANFMRLWGAQLTAQTAQNGLLFTLLVLVTVRTGSSIDGSLLVVAFSLPAVLFSMPAGVIVDRWPKRRVMLAANIVRAVLSVAFLASQHSIPALLALTFVFSATGQLFNPAESGSIPALTSGPQLITANALFQFTLAGSQLLGLVVLSPLLLKLGGPSLYFVVMVGLYALATTLISGLPRTYEPPHTSADLAWRAAIRSMVHDLHEAATVLRHDGRAVLALAQLTISAGLTMLFGLLVPRYVQNVLDIAPDNAVYVFAPMALGVVLGLRLVGFLSKRLNKQTIVTIGLTGVAVCLLGLAWIEVLARVLEQAGAREFIEELGHMRPRFDTGVLSVVLVTTLLFTVPMGFFFSLINAPAQTVIHERAPEAMRGRFLGAQMMLANSASLMLLLLAGVAADAWGVTTVLALFAPVVLSVAFAGIAIQARARLILASRPKPSVEAR